MWCRISRRAVSVGSEGIDSVGDRRRTNIGLEAVARYDIDRAVEQARDEFLQACNVEHSDTGLRLDLDHDIDVAPWSIVAPRHGAEQRRPAHAARAQVTLVPAQDRQGVLGLHGPILTQIPAHRANANRALMPSVFSCGLFRG